MAHLKPIEICAKNLQFNYQNEPTNLSKYIELWSKDIIKLNTSCPYIATLNLKNASLNKKSTRTSIHYTTNIEAELILDTPEGTESKASANINNKMTLSKKLTLAEKEKHILELNEKNISDFDKTMKESIKKYITID